MATKEYLDYQLHFDKRVAKEFGLPEAVVINKFQALIGSNKALGKNYYQGRTWTYNSYEEWVDNDYFSCFSKEQMRRILESLLEQKILMKGNFNKRRNDKTNWYAFVEEEKWIERKSPIANYGSDRPDGFTLPNSAETIDTGLFNSDTLPESAKQEDALPNSADQLKDSAGTGNETAENDKAIGRNQQMDLPDSTNHYQLSPTKSNDVTVINGDAGKNTFQMLIGKTAMEAVNDGTADKLAFEFNDGNLVDEKIVQLFRIFIKDAQPHFSNIDKIKFELLNDSRIELSRKACWVIIMLAFFEYPGWNSKYQNVGSLLGKIKKQKDLFAQKYYDGQKQFEAARDRMKEREQSKIKNEEAINQILKEAADKLERYKHKLNLRQVEEITNLIRNRNYLQADSKLIEYLELNEGEEAA